jgi:hypothetical protein
MRSFFALVALLNLTGTMFRRRSRTDGPACSLPCYPEKEHGRDSWGKRHDGCGEEESGAWRRP